MRTEKVEGVGQIEERIFRKIAFLKERFKDFPLFERGQWRDFEHWAGDAGLEPLVEELDQVSDELICYLRRHCRAVKIMKIQKALQSALERGELSSSDFQGNGFDASGLCFCDNQGQIEVLGNQDEAPF